jgi:hypothetical protein
VIPLPIPAVVLWLPWDLRYWEVDVSYDIESLSLGIGSPYLIASAFGLIWSGTAGLLFVCFESARKTESIDVTSATGAIAWTLVTVVMGFRVV